MPDQNQPTVTQQTIEASLAALDKVMDDIPVEIRIVLIRATIQRIMAAQQGDTERVSLLEETSGMILRGARAISEREARKLLLRITKIVVIAASAVPGMAGIILGALSYLIPDPDAE